MRDADPAFESPIDLPIGVQALLAVVGTSAAVAGTISVFTDEGGSGSAALVTVGLAVVVLALLAPHVKSFKAGGVEVEFRLRKQAEAAVRDLVRSMAEPVAMSYDLLRANMDGGPERTAELDRLVSSVADNAETANFEPEQVAELARGTTGERIVALALMKGDPRLRDFAAVTRGIGDSASAFEQYHALRLAQSMFDELGKEQRGQLVDAIDKGRHHTTNSRSRSPIVADLEARLAVRP